MIVRRHVAERITSTAIYSPCERYRYRLTRIWDSDKPRVLYIMLNPSKATELANDPTIERCQRRATALGFGTMDICNLFAWRETSPSRLRKSDRPVGEDNDAVLKQAALSADLILCAWGVHGTYETRAQQVATLLQDQDRPLHALGETRDGHPRHPLYVSYSVAPSQWVGAARPA